MNWKGKKLYQFLLVASFALTAATAQGQAVITDPSSQYSAGINALGNFFYGDVGIRRNFDIYDPIRPGTPRESWGIGTTGGVTGFADNWYTGNSGLVFNGFGSGGSTAFSSSFLNNGFGNVMQIDQEYSFPNPNIVKIEETVTNLNGTPLPLYFQRDVDWDITPTAFSEITTIPAYGSPPVIDGSYQGFENPSPLVPYNYSLFPGGGTFGPGDLGGGIKLMPGVLNPGESAKFIYLEGISQLGQSPAALTAQAMALGAYYVVTGYSSDGDFYTASHSAFIAVAAVPEPSSIVLALCGAVGLCFAAVRKLRAS